MFLAGALVACAVAALVALRWWLRYLDDRDARRHQWRVELVQARGTAYKAESLEEVKQRLQRLELRQGVAR